MGYEIPKNLQYEEKILFNLSIWQALWIGLFGFLITTIFYQVPIAFEFKAAISIVLGILGLGFAFLDFYSHTKNIAGFLVQPRQMGYTDKRMEKFLDVKKIENDSIHLKNGAVKAIVQVQPINFHILSTKHQQAIIQAYKDFLNSLDFPIQIVMRTVNLSLDDYLKTLEEKVRLQRKEKLAQQFKEFEEFMREYIEKNSIKNRLFYIVIPGETNSPFAKKNLEEQLDIRVKLCQEKLRNCNLVTKRLNTQELVSLLSTYFEGFIEVENEYQSLITILEGRENHGRTTENQNQKQGILRG